MKSVATTYFAILAVTAIVLMVIEAAQNLHENGMNDILEDVIVPCATTIIPIMLLILMVN